MRHLKGWGVAVIPFQEMRVKVLRTTTGKWPYRGEGSDVRRHRLPVDRVQSWQELEAPDCVGGNEILET
jgi:hypothetical protein